MNHEPDRSAAHAAELQRRLRAFLLRDMPMESPVAIAGALMYELVSIAASGAETETDARELLAELLALGEDQLEAFGVGRPHP
jgi:hypothetical protein